MSKFIVILGPPAVGKMAVGFEISKITGFKLFHNHLVIEAVLPVFEFNDPVFKKLVLEFRTRIFEEAIKSKINGIIFTFVPNFKSSGIVHLYEWLDMFFNANYSVYVVELSATLSERIIRNESSFRAFHKASKRDLALSKEILLKNESEWQMKADPDSFKKYNFISLDTTNLSINETALDILNKLKIV